MSATALRGGFVADGIWKALVSGALLAFLPLLVTEHGAPAGLLVVTAFVVLASAAAEIAYAVRDGGASHVRHLIAYDAGWAVASVVAVLLALAGGAGAWAVWLGYQLVAAPIVAVVFARRAARGPTASSARTRGSDGAA